MGGLPCEGVVAKKFVLSLESLSALGFEERNLGCPGNFAGMSRTPGSVQTVCAKKVRAHASFPSNQMKPGESPVTDPEVGKTLFSPSVSLRMNVALDVA